MSLNTGPAATGTAFGLTEAVVGVTYNGTAQPGSIQTDVATQAGGASLTKSDGGANVYQLSIPALGINTTVTANARPTQLANGSAVHTSFFSIGSGGALDYAQLGAWSVSSSAGAPLDRGWFVTGYQTAAAQMPTSGTASYQQWSGVKGEVYGPGATNGVAYGKLSGDVSLTANFSNGTVSGTLSNMTVTSQGQTTVWNTVSVSAQITGSNFSGTTSSQVAPGGKLTLAPTATGFVQGAFYGPTANNGAAVWTLSDGTYSAIGVFGAPKH